MFIFFLIQNNITRYIIILGFYLLCLGFKNLYIVVLFVFLVGWCQFLFMVILFWTSYIVAIKIFRIDLKNLDNFLMLDDLSCMNNSNPIFFKLWIFFDWYGLQWILQRGGFPNRSCRGYAIHCCFWRHVHSLIVAHCV